jgi:hypothetical protein
MTQSPCGDFDPNEENAISGAFDWEIGIWSLGFIWNLALEIWNLILTIASSLPVNRQPFTVNQVRCDA